MRPGGLPDIPGPGHTDRERAMALSSSQAALREADPAWRALGLRVEDLERERELLLATLRQTLSFQSLAEAVSSAQDLPTLLESVASIAGKVLPWRSLLVESFDASNRVQKGLLEKNIGPDESLLVRQWTEDGIIDWLFDVAKPVVIPEGDESEGWVLLPLLVLGRPVGWMAMRPRASVGEIAPHHLQTLALVGSQAAATLDNLAQRDKMKANLAELEGLYNVGARIGSSLDIGEIFQAAADALAERFQPTVIQLAAVDAGHPPRVRALCVRGSGGSDLDTEGILLTACRRAEPVQSCRAFGASPELDRMGVDLLIAVPFVHRGTTVLGGLVVGAPDGSSLDAPDALNWLVALSGLISASLENSRLYEDIVGVNERLSAMQSRLVQAGRLAGIGQLAGGIAHEINNPLQVVMGRIQILQMRLEGQEKALEEVSRIEFEIKRIARIVRGIQDFSHQSRENAPQESVYLSELCESTLEILDHRIRKGRIAVERVGFASALRVLGDPDQLRQVVLNLCLNAVQSMPDGGVLKLTLHKEGDTAILDVHDSGSGIPPENMERIFDPFFTTRSDSVGLGLAIGYAICNRHGGTLELLASAEPKDGTLFRVRLPALASTAAIPQLILPG